MVERWSVKNPLKLDERKKIKEAIDLGMSYSQMALHVGRNKSTVMRESKRLGDVNDYDPEKAQQHFESGQIEKYKNITQTLKEKRAKKAEVVGSTVSRSQSPKEHHTPC